MASHGDPGSLLNVENQLFRRKPPKRTQSQVIRPTKPLLSRKQRRRQAAPGPRRSCSEAAPESKDRRSSSVDRLSPVAASSGFVTPIATPPASPRSSLPRADGDVFAIAHRLWQLLVQELRWGQVTPSIDPSAVDEPSSAGNFVGMLWSLEKLAWFGWLHCFDMVIQVAVLMPLRLAWTVVGLLTTGGRHPLDRGLLFDVLRLAAFFTGIAALGWLDISYVYHYIRGEAVLKLYVILNMLDVFDKVCASLGLEVERALYQQLALLQLSAAATKRASKGAAQEAAAADAKRCGGLGMVAITFVAYASYVVVHSFCMFVWTVALNVAINSRQEVLLTLLISNNFVELKAAVFKRFRFDQMFQMSMSDIVERFKLSMFLALIFLQSVRTWDELSNAAVVITIIMIIETLVDWAKHSFISKFNLQRESCYDDFRWTLCIDVLAARKVRREVQDPAHFSANRMGLSLVPVVTVGARLIRNRIDLFSWWQAAPGQLLWNAVVAGLVVMGLLLLKGGTQILLRALARRKVLQQAVACGEPPTIDPEEMAQVHAVVEYMRGNERTLTAFRDEAAEAMGTLAGSAEAASHEDGPASPELPSALGTSAQAGALAATPQLRARAAFSSPEGNPAPSPFMQPLSSASSATHSPLESAMSRWPREAAAGPDAAGLGTPGSKRPGGHHRRRALDPDPEPPGEYTPDFVVGGIAGAAAGAGLLPDLQLPASVSPLQRRSHERDLSSRSDVSAEEGSGGAAAGGESDGSVVGGEEDEEEEVGVSLARGTDESWRQSTGDRDALLHVSRWSLGDNNRVPM